MKFDYWTMVLIYCIIQEIILVKDIVTKSFVNENYFDQYSITLVLLVISGLVIKWIECRRR